MTKTTANVRTARNNSEKAAFVGPVQEQNKIETPAALDLSNLGTGADHEAFARIVAAAAPKRIPRALREILEANMERRYTEEMDVKHRWFKVGGEHVMLFVKSGSKMLTLPNGATSMICEAAVMPEVVKLLKAHVLAGGFDEQLNELQDGHDAKQAKALRTRARKAGIELPEAAPEAVQEEVVEAAEIEQEAKAD